jgi:hypothetical protein
MGMHTSDGPIGTKIKVPTIDCGEFSATDVDFGRVGRVRKKDGTERVFAGKLLLAAITNGGELIADPKYTPNFAWAEAARLYRGANGGSVIIQSPRGTRKRYETRALESLIAAIAAGGHAVEVPATNAAPIQPTINGEAKPNRHIAVI